MSLHQSHTALGPDRIPPFVLCRRVRMPSEPVRPPCLQLLALNPRNFVKSL